ncbi:hypothetical protein [Yoonia ponticola]|nr:hypothetical protein [Yoonia ponticola]
MMNFAFLRPAVACVMLSGLAACGGGGDSDPVTDVVVPSGGSTTTDTTLSGPRASATTLLATWAPPTYTSLGAIPVSGGANYDGYLFGDLSNESDDITDKVVGSLSIRASFNAGGASFTGTASDFIDSDDNDMTGTLAISGGALDRNGNPASDATVRGVQVAGTLTDNADHDLVFAVQLEGDFLGDSYDAIGGDALGGVSVDGVDQDFDGGFIAER